MIKCLHSLLEPDEKRNFVNWRDRRKRKKPGELSLESSLSATWNWTGLRNCEKVIIRDSYNGRIYARDGLSDQTDNKSDD